MKLNINVNKDDAKALRRKNSALIREIEANRDKYNRIMREVKAAEEEVLTDMFRTIEVLTAAKNGKFPSAAEITAAMNGRMSLNEVVGQLTVALGEHYNGYGKTSKAKHETTTGYMGKVCARYIPVTRQFVECDDYGQPVENGAVITVTDTIKTYGVEGD